MAAFDTSYSIDIALGQIYTEGNFNYIIKVLLTLLPTGGGGEILPLGENSLQI